MAKRSHVVTIDVGEAMWEEMDGITETQGLGKSDLLRTGIWRMHDWARNDERAFVTGLQGHVERGGTKYMLWLSADTKNALQTCIDIAERLGLDTTQGRLLSFIWHETVAKGVYIPAVVGASKQDMNEGNSSS